MKEKGAENAETENKYEVSKNRAESWLFERTDQTDETRQTE